MNVGVWVIESIEYSYDGSNAYIFGQGRLVFDYLHDVQEYLAKNKNITGKPQFIPFTKTYLQETK